MAFEVVQNDIVKMTTDAIVNTIKANVEVGEVTYTKWDSASTRYVIHTTIPTWQGGEANEEEDLRSCFRNSLELAHKLNCHSIAFPLMCIGKKSMPHKLVLEIAVSEVKAFLEQNDMMIYLAIQDDEDFQVAKDYVAKNF
ncbi:MAG: macro domain-containing protein [Roseburia sp.]